MSTAINYVNQNKSKILEKGFCYTKYCSGVSSEDIIQEAYVIALEIEKQEGKFIEKKFWVRLYCELNKVKSFYYINNKSRKHNIEPLLRTDISFEESFDYEEREEGLDNIFDGLTLKERYVAMRILGEGAPKKNVREISEELGISKQRCYVILNNIIEKIEKKKSHSEPLKKMAE